MTGLLRRFVFFLAAGVIAGCSSSGSHETALEYVVRNCPNGMLIQQTTQAAVAARTASSSGSDAYRTSIVAAVAYNQCALAVKDPFARDWAQFNQAYWFSRAAQPNADGLKMLAASETMLHQLDRHTTFALVHKAARDMETSIQADQNRLQAQLLEQRR